MVCLITHNITKATVFEMLGKSQITLACHLTICSSLSDSVFETLPGHIDDSLSLHSVDDISPSVKPHACG